MMMIDKKKIINNNKPGNLNPLTALKLEFSLDRASKRSPI